MEEKEVSIVGNKGSQGWLGAGFTCDVQASGVLSTGRQMRGSKDLHWGLASNQVSPRPGEAPGSYLNLACANIWSLSPQVLTGAVNTIQSFLVGSAQEVVELEGGDPEPGDLFLFGLMFPTRRWCPRGHVLQPRRDDPFQGKRLWLKQALVCEKGYPPKPRCTSGRATREGRLRSPDEGAALWR